MINIVGLREQLQPEGLPELHTGRRAWLFRAGRLSVVRIERRHDGLMREGGRIVPAAQVRIGAVRLRVARDRLLPMPGEPA